MLFTINKIHSLIIFNYIFSPYVHTKPVYITLVRDPVEKFISDYRDRRRIPEKAKKEIARRDKITPGAGK